MAQIIFPPANWNQTPNIIDTLSLEYSTPFPNVSLTLYCEKVKGSQQWWMWGLPGPLPPAGNFLLHLGYYKFDDYINVFPTDCHFDVLNTRNTTQKIAAGGFNINTYNGKVETTWARTTTATSIGAVTTRSTLPSPTAVTSVTSSGFSTATSNSNSIPSQTGSSTNSEDPLTLSQGARIGLGVGVGIGGTILILLAVLLIAMYRKRRTLKTGSMHEMGEVQGNGSYENQSFDKAELLGNPIEHSPYSEMPGSLAVPSPNKSFLSETHSDSSRLSQSDPPQELLASTGYGGARIHDRHPGERFEIGP